MFKIRASSLPSWNDCPRREASKAFRKIIKEAGYVFPAKGYNNIGAAVGSGVHKGSEIKLKDIQDGTTLVKESDIVEVSINEYRKEIKDGVLYDGLTPNNNTAEKQIEVISNQYWNNILPNMVTPDLIEGELKGKIDDTFYLSGHPDVKILTAIHDFKFGKVERVYVQQLGAYALLAEANGYTDLDDLVVNWIPRSDIRKPPKPPKTYHYNYDLCKSEAYNVINIIKDQYKKFLSTGDPGSFPCNTASMLCGDKYCDSKGTDWCPITKQGG